MFYFTCNQVLFLLSFSFFSFLFFSISIITDVQAKRLGECRYPCDDCPKDPPRCKTSRTIMDGCDCCTVCPRQQGDLCDHRYLCDDSRELYCDFNIDAGHRGICRGRRTDQTSFFIYCSLSRVFSTPPQGGL